jgi:hypothetical protein
MQIERDNMIILCSLNVTLDLLSRMEIALAGHLRPGPGHG